MRSCIKLAVAFLTLTYSCFVSTFTFHTSASIKLYCVLTQFTACMLTTNPTDDGQLMWEQAEHVALATTLEEDGHEAVRTDHVIEVMRNRTSSYEDIYTGVDLEQGDNNQTTGETELNVGDRFDTRHADTHLMRRADGRTSSFEDLYGASHHGDVQNDEEAEQTPDDESVASEPSVKVVHPPPPPSTTHKPIDVTYSSGLNLIGQDETCEEPEQEHDRLSRTASLNIRQPAARKKFQRQLSSPDGSSSFPDFQEATLHGTVVD
jgi:hypothetical protein